MNEDEVTNAPVEESAEEVEETESDVAEEVAADEAETSEEAEVV